jgi:tripartite-type tricarboxylate transporter receptor subunit TctC
MTGSMNARLVRAFFCLLFWGVSGFAAASAAGGMPVRVVVPSSPGGAASLQAVLLASAMQDASGRLFIVDHRNGFREQAGEVLVAGSPADGRTLLLASASLAVRAAQPSLRGDFDPLRSLRPVIQVSSTPMVLVVHPAVPADSAGRLLVLARDSRRHLEAAAPAAGSLEHLATALLMPPAVAKRTKLFRGGFEALQSLADGRVDLMFAPAPLVIPLLTGGRLRPLATGTASPHPALNGLPLITGPQAEFVAEQWYGLFAPVQTPDDVVAELRRGARTALRGESAVTLFHQRALSPGPDDPAVLDAVLRRDIARYAALIRRTGLVF